jgi:hypothetical protein
MRFARYSIQIDRSGATVAGLHRGRYLPIARHPSPGEALAHALTLPQPQTGLPIIVFQH